MTDAVRLYNVSRQYIAGDRPAVYGLSLTVGDGKLFVLLGPSGCGKTTTLRLAAHFGFRKVGYHIDDDGLEDIFVREAEE